MAAPRLEIDSAYPNPRHIQTAVEILRKDGVIAYPTDTAYGLGCDLFSRKAFKRLSEMRGPDNKKPFSFICSDLSHLTDFAKVSNFAYRTIRSLTPGPFTFILPATRKVPEILQSRRSEVGIRVPDAEIPLELVRQLGSPLLNATALDWDGELLVDAHGVKEQWGKGLDLILDGGKKLSDLSTVISLMNDEVEILRQGKGVLS